jgi:hypothetical protein
MRTRMEEGIDVVRNHLGEVMVELEDWAPRASGVPARLRQSARPFAVGIVALGAVGLGVWWARSHARQSLIQRVLAHLPLSAPPAGKSVQLANRLKRRLGLARRPEPARHPLRSLLFKLSSASLVAAASVVARHIAARLVEKRTAVPTNQDNLVANFGR